MYIAVNHLEDFIKIKRAIFRSKDVGKLKFFNSSSFTPKPRLRQLTN